MQQPHLVSVRIQAKSSLEESSPAPCLYLPATICNGCNSGNSTVVEQVDPAKREAGKRVIIQTLQCDFL